MKRLFFIFSLILVAGCDSEDISVIESDDVEKLFEDDTIIAVEGHENIKREDMKFAKLMMEDNNPYDDDYWTMVYDHGGLTEFSKIEGELDFEALSRIYNSYGLDYEIAEIPEEDSVDADRTIALSGSRPGDDVARFCGKYFGSYFRGKTYNFYKRGRFIFTHSSKIDRKGRPWFARAELDIIHPGIGEGPVKCANTSLYGSPRDENGHIIAATLGGSAYRINLVPQAFQINRSIFARVESALRACRAKPRTANVYEVIVHYNDGRNDLRPSGFTLRTSSSTFNLRRPWDAIPTWRSVYVNNTDSGARSARAKTNVFRNWIRTQCDLRSLGTG